MTNEEKQLTVARLKMMAPQELFAHGFTTIEHPWFNDAKPVSEGGSLEPDGRSTKVRWAAIRGGTHDWSIYHSLDANFVSEDYLDGVSHLEVHPLSIVRSGAKLRDENKARELVNADDAAMKLYRQ